MKRYEREHEVWRDKKTGRIAKAPGRSRAAAALRRGAAALNLMEDRTGKRLRFGEETAGWWYMVKGPRRWVRRGEPGWYHGYYYDRKHWTPVVPPWKDWETRNSYNGPPGTPLGHAVPRDVWSAAHIFKEDRAGRRSYGEPSARSERLAGKAGRGGVGESASDYPPRKSSRLRATTPTRTPRKRTGYHDERDRRGRFARKGTGV